ncbi:MAG: HAD-IB family phosphatase, partial [Brevundimonas sp.]|nr:HAD-IB family phosphatase [Brevundimonas sp.]
MAEAATYIFDFDSTLVDFETLEVLADIALAGSPEADAVRAKIARLTDRAMTGDMPFGEALTRRLALLPLKRAHLERLAEEAEPRMAASVRRNLAFFRDNADRVVIVSGGFREIIAPVARSLGVAPDRIVANDLVFDAEGRVSGVADSPLLDPFGKAGALKALNLPGPVVMVGDGWTDAEVKQAGVADRFYAFTEVVRRPNVVAAADAEVRSVDELLHLEGLAGRWSYPRSRMRMLLLENIHPAAVERLQTAGYRVETAKGALGEDALIERIKGVHVLGVRSKTQVSARVLEAADKLMAVAAFCIGTNQIDLDAAAERGVAVFNAPYSNTRSVVELAVGLTISLLRDVADKSAAMHRGEWNKSATGSRELRGKTLGIVGYGAIGSQLSVLAEALGMRVIFHDLTERLALGNARRMPSLEALLAESDVVSLHVDGRSENTALVGAAELSRMKPGALLLN